MKTIMTITNKGWNITVKVVAQDGKHRVDVYDDAVTRLNKSFDCATLREALIKACDIVGEA